MLRHARLALWAVAIYAGSSTSVVAACWWEIYGWRCDPHCWITYYGSTIGGRRFVEYQCIPLREIGAFIVAAAGALIFVGLLGSIIESLSGTSRSESADEIDAQIQQTKELAEKLAAASREADAHLNAFRSEGGRLHGDTHHD